MRQFALHLFSFICICLLIVNCKHEPPPPPAEICQYDSSIEEMKQWYYFKEGTQWIYEEQNTGELDTATVYDSNDGDSWFDYYVFHSKGGWINNYYFSLSSSIYCLIHKECTCHKVFKARGKPGEYVGEVNAFLYPIILNNYDNLAPMINGQPIYGARNTITDTNLLYQVGNDTLKNVVRWQLDGDGSINGWPSVYLVCRNVGLINMEFPHTNEIWKLISYHVIQ